jgi:hypothetical protein
MGSKLEYWILQSKIAVVVLDVMIEDGVGVVVPVIFYLVNYYGGNWKIQKSPNCPKISQFPILLPMSNFQSPKIIQPERYCAGRPIITI